MWRPRLDSDEEKLCNRYPIGYQCEQRKSRELSRVLAVDGVMSRNKEKQKNELNRLSLAKTHAPKPKRPHLSQIHTVDELRRWLPNIDREIHTTLAQTTSARYTDEKVEAMYRRISELEAEHKSFRRKIAQLELGPDVHVITRTIPVVKQIDFYTKKSTARMETLDEFFDRKPELPLLSTNGYEPVSLPQTSISAPVATDSFSRSSLVDYSDSD